MKIGTFNLNLAVTPSAADATSPAAWCTTHCGGRPRRAREETSLTSSGVQRVSDKESGVQVVFVILIAALLSACRGHWTRPPAWSEKKHPIWVVEGQRDQLYEKSAKDMTARIIRTFPSAHVIALNDTPTALQQCITENGLLVLADVAAFPQEHWPALEKFLNEGGAAIFVGTRPFELRAVRGASDSYISERDWLIQMVHTAQAIESVSSVAAWEHRNAQNEISGSVRIAPSPAAGWAAVRVQTDQLSDWDALILPEIRPGTLRPEHRTMVFYARGSKHTTRLFVQCTEDDGTTWRISVPVTPIWSLQILHEGEFECVSSPPHNTRQPDTMSFARVRSITVGVSAETDYQPVESSLFYVSDVRWLADPRTTEEVRRWPNLPLISPPQRRYSTRIIKVRSLINGRVWTLKHPLMVGSPFPRPQGYGGRDGLNVRWIPLCEALDEHETVRGWPSSIFVEVRSNRVMRRWAWLGVPPEMPEGLFQSMLREAAQKLQAGIYLHHVGQSDVAITEGELLSISAAAAWRNAETPRLDVIAELYREGKRVPGRRVRVPMNFEGQAELSLGPAPAVGPEPEVWSIRIDLVDPAEGILYDSLTQFLTARPQQHRTAPADWITTAGGQFVYRGRRQFWIGIHYAPASLMGRIGEEPEKAGWLLSAVFDPAVIERDFRQLAEAGVNAVALDYRDEREAPSLHYVADVAKRHGLWICLRLPPWDPLEPDVERLERLCKAADLGNEPIFFALDISPAFACEEKSPTSRWDAAWREWLVEQYSSVEHAENILHISLTPGHTSSFQAAHAHKSFHEKFTNVLVGLAYERFLDDFFSRRYGHIVRRLHSQGIRQLITARTHLSNGGASPEAPILYPNPMWGRIHLDFISLHISPWTDPQKQRRDTAFWTALARGVSGGKPVLWTDYAVPLPDTPPIAADLESQAAKFALMFDAVFQNRAAGLFGGWYPGGCYAPTGQDTGLTEPDGSWRPVGRVYREASNRVRRERGGAMTMARGHTVQVHVDCTAIAEWKAKAFDEYTHSGRVAELRPADMGKRSTVWIPQTLGKQPFLAPAPMCSMNAEWGRIEVNGTEVARAADQLLRLSRGSLLRAEVLNTGWVSWDGAREGQPRTVWVRFSTRDRAATLLSIPPTLFGKKATITWVATDVGEWTARPWLAGVGEFGEALRCVVDE